MVGVNCFEETQKSKPLETMRISDELEKSVVERVRAYRLKRSALTCEQSLQQLRDQAQGQTTGNLQASILAAVKAGATLGEISATLQSVFGIHHEYAGF